MTSSVHNEDGSKVVAVELGDGFALLAPPQNRVVRSAELVNGVPVLNFEEPPTTVQPLTEEDMAVACRLARENTRPEFYFIPFPPNHPLEGRQLMMCEPEWIEGTSVYKILLEADWAMKGLHVGVKSNAERTKFWAWQTTSHLEGQLATRLDFPVEKKKKSGSVIMSCEYVKVRKSDTKLEFVGEPKLHINDENSTAYTRYINRVLPSVAHYDEPLFLKVQEIIKLLLVSEWLVKAGVKISAQWIAEHTDRPTLFSPKAPPTAGTVALQSNEGGQGLQQAAAPLQQTGPGTCATKNVAMKRSEARRCKKVRKGVGKSRYGWYDHGSCEMVQFEEDGKPCTRIISLKSYFERRVIVNGELKESVQVKANIPFLNGLFSDPTSERNKEKLCQFLQYQSEFTGILGAVSSQLDIKRENDDVEILISAESNPLCLPHLKVNGTLRGTISNYDMLYKGLDPNTPLYKDVVPKVQSWNHLFSKTVPWPRVWQVSYGGGGVTTSGGGVTTRNIPVIEERTLMREPARLREPTIPQSMPYEGSWIRQLVYSEEKYNEVVQKFRSKWSGVKGECPPVNYIFEVNNVTHLNQWSGYMGTLSVQTVEEHFHGTSLACHLAVNKKLCSSPKCGICGISGRGLDRMCIGTKIDFQRFGDGFYLAPNSSKCHDYTEGAHNLRAMLLCDVCPGRKYQLQHKSETLSRPVTHDLVRV